MANPTQTLYNTNKQLARKSYHPSQEQEIQSPVLVELCFVCRVALKEFMNVWELETPQLKSL